MNWRKSSSARLIAAKAAKKLQCKIDRGEGGEKENARLLLHKIMAKHGISLADLDETNRELRDFQAKKDLAFLLNQVLFAVLGSDAKVYHHKRNKGKIMAECTQAEFVEATAMFGFYSKKYSDDLETFKYAFINVNHIFSPDEKAVSPDEMSEKALERARKAAKMSLGIDKHQFFKQLPEIPAGAR